MQSLRDRRLVQDYKALKQLEASLNAEQTRLEIKEIVGQPPTEYHLVYHCPGYIDTQGTLRRAHKVDLRLPEGYPEKRPIFRMLDKPYVVHPNIWKTGLVCIADNWKLYMPLEELVLAVSHMIRLEPRTINGSSLTDRFGSQKTLAQFLDTIKYPTDNKPFVG